MTQILTDSCADLSPELLKTRQIRSLPLQVFINNRNYHDGDLTLQQLFSLVNQTGQLPKTSAPSVKDFVQFFENASEAIYIGISSRLSATIQTSQLALAELDGQNIQIIDSLNLSTGIGLLALKAADLRDAGLTQEQITFAIRNLISKIRTSFVIDTMEYLYKGGRCNPLQAIFGSLLKIRPVIEVRPDGTLGVKDKIRGSRQKALDSLVDDFRAELDHIDLQRVFITHTDCKVDSEYLRSEIIKTAPVEEILITTAGATIASHCGPNTIGLLYCLR